MRSALVAAIVAALLTFVVGVRQVKCATEWRETSSEATSATPWSLPTAKISARHNFLLGVAEVGLRHENNTRCGKELESLLKAADVGELWSLKVINTFGGAPKSFGWGNYFWFSSPILCDDLNTPYSISFSAEYKRLHSFNFFNVTSPFPLRFTVIHLRFSSPFYIDLQFPYEYLIHAGLCLPQSCSVTALERYADEYFQLGDFVTQRDYELQLKAVGARVPALSWSILQQTGTIISILVTCALTLLTTLAELVHRSKKKLKLQKQQLTKTPLNGLVVNMPQSPTTASTIAPVDVACKSLMLEELLLCFRLSDNWRRALQVDELKAKTNSKSNFLGVIAGLRTIVCLWIAVFHVYYYSLFAMSNTPMIFAKLEGLLYQPVMQACFYVDVFFVISAFLLVYNFLTNESQLKTIRQSDGFQTLKLYVHLLLQRYMRLTPLLIVTILLSDVAYDLLNMYTPFYVGVHSGLYCKRRWWYNLLYIHNFSDMRDICCSWSWYLGCEMQFFVLFMALLFVYAKNKQLGQIAYVTVTLGFVVISWLCNYHNGITFQLDVVHNTLNELYVKPWVRINPYSGGALCGWLLHHYRHRHVQRQQLQSHRNQQQEQQQQKQKQQQQQTPLPPQYTPISGSWRVAFWLLCALFYVATNFMSYWRTTPIWLVATIMSFGKLLFALCVGGVIILCAWGYGGHLNRLLSARVFRFLNKFCFSIYLVAPLIVMLAFGLRNEATNFTEVSSGTDFLAIIAVSIASAFLVVVLVELPMQRVTSRLLRK